MAIIRSNVAAAAGYVPGEQPMGGDVIKLNTNENPYSPSPRVMEAIRAVTAEQLRRYPSPSGEAFRKAAAGVHGVGADWILPFNGGDELLSVAIRAAAGETDAVAFLEPSYSLYPVLAEMNGSRKVVLSYEIEGVEWRLPRGVEEVKASVLLVVNPNAPSGHLDPVGRLMEIAERFKGLLVIDEAYVDFAPVNALEVVKRFSNVVILRTMSKGYSLAGLRFGYAIGQPTLLRELAKVRDSYPVDAVATAAATAGISDQAYARETWEKVKRERARLSGELQKMGFVMPESASNFLLATVPGGGGMTGRGVYEAMKSKGILIRWWDLPRISDKVRITVGTPEQNDRLIAELRRELATDRH
ncbi:MAG: histidinol-phosphate transaminase [Phycisphaerales bacterium]|nr:histidinol-phosphate transaminase [Phycisphaerales bacterium]